MGEPKQTREGDGRVSARVLLSPEARRQRNRERAETRRVTRKAANLCINCPVDDVQPATRGQLCDDCADVAAEKARARRGAPAPMGLVCRPPTAAEREALFEEFGKPDASGWTWVQPMASAS